MSAAVCPTIRARLHYSLFCYKTPHKKHTTTQHTLSSQNLITLSSFLLAEALRTFPQLMRLPLKASKLLWSIGASSFQSPRKNYHSASSARTIMSAKGGGGPGQEFWEARYREAGFAYGTEPNDFLKDTIPKLEMPSGSTCLLLADGEGRNGVYMATQGFQATAVDYSEEGIKKAKQLAKQKSVALEAIVADLADYDLGTSKWDCIVGIYSHLPPPLRTRVLQGIPTALKPGGYFVLECYTPKQIEYKTGGPPVPELMYSKEILSDAFEGKLEIQRNEELVRDVVEGKYHTGKGAVVQFIGRKK
jgi:SAM-dependent methyltransferase